MSTARKRLQLHRENQRWPEFLVSIPKKDWPEDVKTAARIEVWRSRFFLVQVFDDGIPGIRRMSVIRAKLDEAGMNWADRITWEELQTLKREIGRGDKDAMEVYPDDGDVVNVTNMRHLFILEDGTRLAVAWRRHASTDDAAVTSRESAADPCFEGKAAD